MESTQNGERKEANQNEDMKTKSSSGRMKLGNYIPLHVPPVEEGLHNKTPREKRFLDFLKAKPSKEWLLKFGFVTRFRRSQSHSTSVNPLPPDPIPSVRDGGRRFRVQFVRKINWEALVRYCKNWVKHPMNKALLVWLFFVAACLVVLFLLMVGLLNQAIPRRSVRKRWTEILNQILNALFTIMSLYQHPRISHHLALLCRWRSSDITELRGIYCKNSTRKPHERAHMLFVVICLHITCLSQYFICALYWAYTSKTRPDWPQILFIVLGTGAPIIAGLYTIYSPLGRKTESENDEESQQQVGITIDNEDTKFKLFKEGVVVTSPEWVGGLFDCWDDLTVAYLSFFCTFCVFGWNMERLGFGNMYVHIFTFILLCSAPVLVFSVTALNISDHATRYIVAIAGIVLCLFGFLYGGFWRVQMRKRFKLPANPFCCGYATICDFMQWLFCWSCSLAQEVRTGNFYDLGDDSFYMKESQEGSQKALVPLPRENGAGPLIMSTLESAKRMHYTAEADGDPKISRTGSAGEIPQVVSDELLRPPLQPLINGSPILGKSEDLVNVVPISLYRFPYIWLFVTPNHILSVH